MSNISRIIAKEMSKSKGEVRVIRGKCYGYILPNVEWLKWLSYVPKFEEERIRYLSSKSSLELSLDEIDELKRYHRNRKFQRLFECYNNSTCTSDEYMQVFDYMCDESIEAFMITKLTSFELDVAKKKIIELYNEDDLELKRRVITWGNPKVYEQLSMVDSYIFHFANKINYNKDMSRLKDEIHYQIERNKDMEYRSFQMSKNYHG